MSDQRRLSGKWCGQNYLCQIAEGAAKTGQWSISIKGIDTKNTTAAGLSRHIGLIFQNPNDQIFKSNVLDEVMFGPLNIMKEENGPGPCAGRPGESGPGK